MSTPLDSRGNPDVMGSRKVSGAISLEMEQLKLDFNALHAQLHRDATDNPESARLMEIARTHLEIACMAAIKSLSRE